MTLSVAQLTSTSSVATTSASKLDDLPTLASEPSEHIHRRFFIGPMPEKVLPSPGDLKEMKKKRNLFRLSSDSHGDEANETIVRIVKDSARSFFLHEGGREEDWGENEEQNTREEMYRRWKESDWGVVLEGDHSKHVATNCWVGGSFEIGNIAGINIMQGPETMSRVSSRTSAHSLATRLFPLDSVIAPSESDSVAAHQSFVTAPSKPPASIATVSPKDGSSSTVPGISEDATGNASGSANSSTYLLRPAISPQPKKGSAPSQARTEPPRRPIMKLPSFSKTDNPVGTKGKTVHYDLSPITLSPVQDTVSPAEVLGRTGEEVADTSAGSMSVSALSNDEISWGDVLLRDRMLVRVYSSDLDVMPRFNESVHRTARDLNFEDWGEFLVVWRKDRLELYENYSISAKEWVTGHKHLAYIVPLKSARTRLSLYSFVDLTFCITCPPTSRRFDPKRVKWVIHSSKERSNIFIFKLRSRSRAMDWLWQLWRHQGGKLPPVVEIRNPRLDSKVKIDMPNVDSVEAYKIFARENVVALSVQSLHAVRDWKYSIERQIAEGKILQLCWRLESTLDWIWLDNDVEGRPREWAVLCGLALQQLNVPVHLEIRLGEHYPQFVHGKDGTRIKEPPAIEGYLERYRANSQSKQSIYLSTHEGNLFALDPSRAHPPSPLGATLEVVQEGESYAETLRRSEVKRGIKQTMNATGVCDLRSILAVRRAMNPVMRHRHELKEDDDERWARTWQVGVPEGTQSDEEDEGGEEAFTRSADKRKLRTRRSFELLLKSGHVVRFEAYSCKYALEWVERLQALVHYWKTKHRCDAQEEMEVSQAHRPRLTPQMYAEADRTIYAETPPDESSPLPGLGHLYNWCVLEGCKPIIRSGKLFMRKGLHGQYKLVELFLVQEQLIQFHITPRSALHTSMRRKINLSDAYVGSGYFAAQVLPSGQYNPEANNVPRRYQDGLEADDPEEDRLFVIWYRKSVPSNKQRTATLTPENKQANEAIPPLAAKRRVAIFRTRSKLERDSWCWALNSELERVVRARKEREGKMRESGGLMDL